VEVPDTIEGAFDKAVEGVTAIAHLASPVSFNFTDPDYVINTAVNGTTSI
jgi:nucleoside-diphosphate-sugar epimerase